VTFRLTTQDHERLEMLRKETAAETLSEVLLRALSTYDLLAEHLKDGFVLTLDPPDELCTSEEVEELEQEVAYLLGRRSSAETAEG
jgi:hypothetical protein